MIEKMVNDAVQAAILAAVASKGYEPEFLKKEAKEPNLEWIEPHAVQVNKGIYEAMLSLRNCEDCTALRSNTVKNSLSLAADIGMSILILQALAQADEAGRNEPLFEADEPTMDLMDKLMAIADMTLAKTKSSPKSKEAPTPDEAKVEPPEDKAAELINELKQKAKESGIEIEVHVGNSADDMLSIIKKDLKDDAAN